MARAPNRSEPGKITITLPAQTFAYLVKLASVGALGQNEAAIAAHIVVAEVERLMRDRRAETLLTTPIAAMDSDPTDE